MKSHGFRRSGKCCGCVATVHVLIRGYPCIIISSHRSELRGIRPVKLHFHVVKGTSIQTARALAMRRPLAAYTAVPARRLRPSTSSGQPMTTQRSPSVSGATMVAHNSPRTIVIPSCEGITAKAPVQSSAAHKNSDLMFLESSASDASGSQGAAIMELPFTWPGKMRRPSASLRSGPHTKHPGKG